MRLSLIYTMAIVLSPGIYFGQKDSVEVVTADTIMFVNAPSSLTDSVISYAETFSGCKYGYGSCGPKSFDCSGFVMHVYGRFGVKLPHTSGGIAELCENVKWKKLQPGDLLFFSGRKVSKKNIGHLAIVKSVDSDKVIMIHATVHAGVLVEAFDQSAYFKKRFIRAGRLTTLEKI